MAKSLQEVLEENSIQTFESSNGRRVANCPFHEGDRRPSFTLYPNETYFCFGCKVWGNPVKFLVDYKGMTGAEAQAYVGVEQAFPKIGKRVIKRKNTLKASRWLMNVVVDYHEYLLQTKGAKQYLLDRGLTDKTIKEHMIGYTDGSALQNSLYFQEDHELAEELGLVTKTGYEVLSHRIVIPNLIDREYCDFMVGRTVINDKIKYLGLSIKPKPIMGFHQYRHSPILFIVEGQFDWLLLKQWGFPAVVLGGSYVTRANQNLLKNKFLVYIPDNDKEGQRAAQEIVDKFGNFNTAIIDISGSGYKDVSEWSQYNPTAREQFTKLIEEALYDILSSNPTWEKYVPQLNVSAPLVSI